MKNLQTFDEFINEELSKKQFISLEDFNKIDALIENPYLLKYIPGREFYTILNMGIESTKLKNLLDAVDFSIYGVTWIVGIAKIFPEYADIIIEKMKSAKKIESWDLMTLSSAIGIDAASELINKVPKTQYMEMINKNTEWFPIFKNMNIQPNNPYELVDFIVLPDELLSIKDKQRVIDKVNKKAISELKQYVEDPHKSKMIGMLYNPPYSNPNTDKQNKFFNKFSELKDTPYVHPSFIEKFNNFYSQMTIK